MKARLIAMLMICGLAAPLAALEQAAPAAQPAEAAAAAAKKVDEQDQSPRIDVVFVLDTTGSMSGLIEGAKQKIWSIANRMATAEPRPRIRLGLVGYRDKGDAYVTQRTALTDDLDAVYADLMKYEADGGGDTPESVNRALHEAVTAFDWGEGPSTLRIVYLVGDAPPHMDYEDDVKYPETCAAAAKAGIIINTIQCGRMPETEPVWREIARRAEGEYFAIQQDGAVVAIATPFDEELARLGSELEATVVAYGTREEQAVQLGKIAMSATVSAAPTSAEARAERAAYKASAAGMASLCGTKDLVQDCLEKKVDPAALPAEQLTPEMQKMSPAERAAFIEAKAKERARCQTEIAALNEKRQAFIRAKLAEAGRSADSFDAAILESLTRQGARAGLEYREAK